MDKRAILAGLLSGTMSPGDARGYLSQARYVAPGIGIDVHRGPGAIPDGYRVRVALQDGGSEVMTLARHRKLFDVPAICFIDFSGEVEELH